MSIAFWTGATGMKAYQSALNVTAHNIANVNTSGYKTQRPAFDELLRSRINTNVPGEHLVGHGVKQEYVDHLMGQSSLSTTDYPLDFAIAGDGFFAVDSKGTREYTRNGAFELSVEGGTAYLTTNDGAYVLNASGARIQMPLDAEGMVETGVLKDQLGIFAFRNPAGLTPSGNARYTETDVSGPSTQVGQAEVNGKTNEVLQYTLEASSVDLSEQMVNIINSQRAFQMNSRVVQTADAIMDLLNNMR